MATLMMFSLPMMACLLIALAVAEVVLRWLGKHGVIPWLRERTGRSLSATAFNEYTAVFQGSKRIELDYQHEMLMLRQEDGSGAPPHIDVDLTKGIVVVRPPATDETNWGVFKK